MKIFTIFKPGYEENNTNRAKEEVSYKISKDAFCRT